MKKTALIIMIITLLSKFLGFGREMSLANTPVPVTNLLTYLDI